MIPIVRMSFMLSGRAGHEVCNTMVLISQRVCNNPYHLPRFFAGLTGPQRRVCRFTSHVEDVRAMFVVVDRPNDMLRDDYTVMLATGEQVAFAGCMEHSGKAKQTQVDQGKKPRWSAIPVPAGKPRQQVLTVILVQE